MTSLGRNVVSLARSVASLGHGIIRRVIEFPVAGAVKKALPLVPVEHEHPASWIIGDAHQNPVTVARHGQLMRIIVPASHGGTKPPGNKGFSWKKSYLNGTG